MHSHELFVLWSIPSSSFLGHFKNGPEYLKRGDSPGVIFLWWGSWYIVCFRVVFSFFWDTLWLFFFRLQLFDGSRFQYSQEFGSVLIFSWFDSSILSVMCCFSLFLIAWHIFLSHIPSLWPDYIFLFLLWGFPFLFRFWQTIWCTLDDWFFLAIY